jgi:UDP-N-acetylglucosamine 4-epimerase
MTHQKIALVTGVAGFIGSALADKLISLGYEVKGLDNFSTGKRENLQDLLKLSAFTLIEGDIRDFEICQKSVKGVEVVFHQAALGSVPRSVKDPLTTHDNNVTGFLNMLLSARDANVKRFVYASSSSVYGDSVRLPKVEGEEGRVLSPYAFSKKSNEEYARLFFNLYGFPTVGLRYFNVFGPRQDEKGAYAAVIPLFIKAALAEEAPFINGDGTQSRDFTFIDNVVDANIKAALSESKAWGRAFNVGCGERVNLLELYSEIRKIVGSGKDPIHREVREGDVKDSLADLERTKKFLGYNPFVNWREGLQKTVDWYRN